MGPEPIVVTLHRPSNVDDPDRLRRILGALREIAEAHPVIFPAHPRTQQRMSAASIDTGRVRVVDPIGYFAMLDLLQGAYAVVTDSGGVQEETTALGVPCLTLRDNTERPITVEQGTNTLVGRDREAILRGVADILQGGGKRGRIPELWDGHAAERIAADLWQWLGAASR
jgi:UDP-N-acetylglucosamine 2-epimerase (non-hydrolysing)